MQQNEQHGISRAAINRISIGIILLIILIQIGFFKTYIQHFPRFADTTTPSGRIVHFNWIMHVHGMVMMGWVLMLLVQPILILKGKAKLHRRVGSLSYVLASLVVLTLYLAARDAYFNALEQRGKITAVSAMVFNIPQTVFFSILFALAILYRHRPALHMRYMCSTAFLFINPPLDRALAVYFKAPGFATGIMIVLAFSAAVAIIDSWRTKRVSPFTLVFGFFLLHKILFELRLAPFWQTIGSAIAKIF